MDSTSLQLDFVKDEPLLEIPQNLAGDYRLIDRAEVLLSQGKLIDCMVKEEFEGGMYIRTIFIPAGTMLTSRIHKYEHTFIIKSGICSVFTAGRGVEHIIAPYHGITKPLTRRMIVTYEDVVWTTYHQYSGPERNDMVDILTYKHENLLTDFATEKQKLMKGAVV